MLTHSVVLAPIHVPFAAELAPVSTRPRAETVASVSASAVMLPLILAFAVVRRPAIVTVQPEHPLIGALNSALPAVLHCMCIFAVVSVTVDPSVVFVHNIVVNVPAVELRAWNVTVAVPVMVM